MSLLWTQAARHEAMPWVHNERSMFSRHEVKPVKKAGFASYTGDQDEAETWLETLRDNDQHDPDKFDEDLWEDSRPEPTAEDEAHHEEHGEYPESHYDQHYVNYEKAKKDKAAEDIPDRHDPELSRFASHHGQNNQLWHNYGHFGEVDLTKPVHAMQSHVSQNHIDRYKANPGDLSEHQHMYGDYGEYPGHDGPMFVTHHGELHAMEGHHRVAAALQSGKKSIQGWHYDLDKDPAKTKAQYEVEGDETWKDPSDWDEDDHEMYSGGHYRSW